MVIVDQFRYQGRFFVVTYSGSVYEVVSHGSPHPSDWTYHLVVSL